MDSHSSSDDTMYTAIESQCSSPEYQQFSTCDKGTNTNSDVIDIGCLECRAKLLKYLATAKETCSQCHHYRNADVKKLRQIRRPSLRKAICKRLNITQTAINLVNVQELKKYLGLKAKDKEKECGCSDCLQQNHTNLPFKKRCHREPIASGCQAQPTPSNKPAKQLKVTFNIATDKDNRSATPESEDSRERLHQSAGEITSEDESPDSSVSGEVPPLAQCEQQNPRNLQLERRSIREPLPNENKTAHPTTPSNRPVKHKVTSDIVTGPDNRSLTAESKDSGKRLHKSAEEITNNEEDENQNMTMTNQESPQPSVSGEIPPLSRKQLSTSQSREDTIHVTPSEQRNHRNLKLKKRSARKSFSNENKTPTQTPPSNKRVKHKLTSDSVIDLTNVSPTPPRECSKKRLHQSAEEITNNEEDENQNLTLTSQESPDSSFSDEIPPLARCEQQNPRNLQRKKRFVREPLSNENKTAHPTTPSNKPVKHKVTSDIETDLNNRLPTPKRARSRKRLHQYEEEDTSDEEDENENLSLTSQESHDSFFFDEIPPLAHPSRVGPLPSPLKLRHKCILVDEHETGKKRFKWTHEENQMLRDGLRVFGVGNWAKIKEEYGFPGRSNVQIKDRYRTLVKKNEL